MRCEADLDVIATKQSGFLLVSQKAGLLRFARNDGLVV
jgi:hypothetical protein